MLGNYMPTNVTEHYENSTHRIQSSFTACGQANRYQFNTFHEPLMWLDYGFSDKRLDAPLSIIATILWAYIHSPL